MIVLGLNQLNPVADVLKKRFTNLSVSETINLSQDILQAINKQLKEEYELPQTIHGPTNHRTIPKE